MNQKKLMITVDVEAQPLRAKQDPLNCLIWGEYPQGRLGIGEMMDIADQHGVKLTMFLDYCEKDIYGEALLDVGREIHRRGHDLQLHAHLNFLDQSFWSKHNIKPEFLLNKVDDVLARATLDFLCEQHQIVTGSKAVAFRGGGYRYNDALLKAMLEHGVILDSSLNISRATQPVTLSPSKQFLWSSGCLEIPVSCVAGYRNLNYFFDFNFNSGYFTNVDAMIEYLDIFYSERGEDAVAVLVMHSWSFLKLTDRKYFTESVPEYANRFAEFLDSIKDKIEVITASDLVYLHSDEKLALDETLDFKNFDPPPILSLKETSTINLSSKQEIIAPSSPVVVTNLLNECCPICGAEKARFVQMNGRRCPDCGSLERQRCFAIAYDQIIHQEFNFADKHVLIFSPSVSELQFLKSCGIAGKTSIDIRPDSNPDIIADICSMPQIESGSQICVFASYIMPNVYDMEAALDEIARILAPEGVFFSVEMLTAGSPTTEIEKEESITGWYGQEAFEKYRVGSFRILGEDDYFYALSKRFTVSRYAATDPITDQVIIINMCKPLVNKKHIIIETNNFQEIDIAFANYKIEHPDATYAQFSVSGQFAYIKRGNLHPTLGTKTQKFRDFWEAGKSDFSSYQQQLKICPNHRIVDYGCGSLRLGAHFIRYLDPGCYFGLDVTTDFIELGKEVLGEEILNEKKPEFGAIKEEVIAVAEDFGADFVISTACAFQIHPDEKMDFILNIKRLAKKKSCIICFDTKIGKHGLRYKSSAWVWSLEYYLQAMTPLVLLSNHKISQHHEAGHDFEGQILVFGHSQTQSLDSSSASLSTITELATTTTPKAEKPVSVIDASFDQLMRDIVSKQLNLPRNQARLLPHVPLNATHKNLTKDFKEILAPVLTSWKDLANPELAIKASELADYETESIDVFLSFGVLDFLENFSDTLNNTFRLLRQGGLALFYLKRLRIVEGTNPPNIAYLCDPIVYGLPENSRLPSMKVGRTWLLNALAEVGFEPEHFEFCSEESGETVEWFVGHKPGSTVLTDSTLETDYQEEADPVFCDICGADLSSLAKNETTCPHCHSRPRIRTIVKLGERLWQIFPSGSQAENRILLGFAMSGAEDRALIPTVYGRLQSVSLYGKYCQGHEEGVDIRDLSHYDNASFDGVFGCLLFDYFEEHEVALGEIARVLKPGGVFFTHIAPYRLSADPDSPPKTTSIIKKRPNYFDYIPDDANMPSINVGRSWFLNAIKRAGLEPELVEIVDKQSGEKIDWFLGIKAGTDTTTKSLFKTNPINLSHSPVCYSIPLPEDSGYRLLDITISLPELPDSLTGMDFAEHIIDSATGSPTKTVVLCGTGSLCVSDDLGESWRTIQTKGFEDYRWWNCFTTSTGRHIVQSLGWQGTNDPVTDPDKHAALLLFDQNWQCIGRTSAGNASWHGSASIGESGGVIMFAEYHNNSERYKPDFKEKQQEYIKSLRPNAIWRSTDDGISWHKVLEFSPLEIRHFHTVIPDHFLPGTWWASSGDRVDESRVWRTDDNGDNWIEVTNPYPDICLPIMSEKLKCHRYTDAIIEKDSIIWGADDYLGSLSALDETLPLSERTGSRIYISPKTSPLLPRELGIIGHPIRKFVDVGPGWIIFTEAKEASIGLRPQVFLLFKNSFLLVKLMELENWRNVATGFTYSRGSKVAYNGCFFIYRSHFDVFDDGIRCLKWQVKFQ
jgi:ubiquinone/menaquinone biosynthesis C-methylase UbiE